MKKSMHGAALIITVWLIALATVLALNYSQAVRSDIKITTAGVAHAQARAAAEAGFWRAVYEIQSPLADAPWPTNGTAVEFAFGDAQVNVTTQDLRGLADLNSASDKTLNTIISYALQDALRADKIVARILDWRDRDNTALPAGAEDNDYAAAGLSHESKDAPFNAREELQLVLGVTAEEYGAIAPFVTVHSQQTAIDLAVAPSYVARANSESESSSEAATAGDRRQRISQVIGTRRSQRRGGLSFEILAEGRVNGVISRLAASVEISRSRRNGPQVAILAWRETWPYVIPKEDIDENPSAG